MTLLLKSTFCPGNRWCLCSSYLNRLSWICFSTCPDDEPHWLVRNASTNDWLCDFAEEYLNKLKDGLIKEIETCSILCKTKHLIHKKGLQHELQFVPKAPLPNFRMNQFSPSLEVNSYRDVGQYWGKSVLNFSCIVSPICVSNSLEVSFQVERKPICFHIKAFTKAVSKYPIHLRETYA